MNSYLKIMSVAVILAVGICGCDSPEQQVAEDLIKQYELALKGGDQNEIAMNAALVAEAYKQLGDEKNYLKWKKIASDKGFPTR